ncbi:hypothetical protein GN958_ATG15746 [Phytophthora infestans]|uniref:Secreted protein n=1 Tax=Phytophthora infestans TaxID=4787 RepID=A0A8S9U2E0_PHYIN|nr:hypothetical protein GN958_ATG15746 [Phytophthora infestans]
MLTTPSVVIVLMAKVHSMHAVAVVTDKAVPAYSPHVTAASTCKVNLNAALLVPMENAVEN